MDFRRTCLTLALAGFALAAGIPPARALTPGTRAALSARRARPARVLSIDNQRRVDINNLNMFITNFGSYAYDLTTGNAGLIYPKGTTKTAVFAAGLWLGAKVSNQIRVTVAEYSQEYGPGTIDTLTGAWASPSDARFKTYKVLRLSGDPADTSHVDRLGADLAADPTLDPLAHHSWAEYMAGAAPFGAPVRTYHIPSAINPADTVDIVGPDVLGDQMLWSVYNDANPANHTNEAGNSLPLDVQVSQTTFAFNRQGALGNTIFLRWQIVHPKVANPPAGTAFADTLKDMFVSMWADPDLGDANDDLEGCDTTLSLGFIYNATNSDQLYGSNPPAVGWDFFLGPKPTAQSTVTLPMTSFNKYINGTDPTSATASYNYMQGLNADGTPLIDPVTGEPTRFNVSGDPVANTGFLDKNASDHRLQLSSGPFIMAPGDTQVIVGALIVGQGSDRLASITGLKFFDISAQDAFNVNFNLPPPPPQPKVAVLSTPNQIELSWGSQSQFAYQAPPGYAFEGYNVYQGATVAGPWKRLATFDIVNGIKVVRDTVFDQITGQLITDFPTAFGGDNGLGYEYTATQDAINGGPLRNGTVYYYAVTAYAVATAFLAGLPTPEPRVLENPQTAIATIPQGAPSGTDITTASTAVTQLGVDPTFVPTTDAIVPNVADPTKVTGHIYKIVFTPTPGPPVPIQVGPDTATVLYTWSLVDSTAGDSVLLANQTNRRGDADYQVVDGVQWVEAGDYFPFLKSVTYLNNNSDHRRALRGVNHGFSQDFFFGGANYGSAYLGSTLNPATMLPKTMPFSILQPDSFVTVEVRFSGGDTTSVGGQMAYRYFFQEDTLRRDTSIVRQTFPYAGFHPVAFQVWDTWHNVQLDAGFTELQLTDTLGTALPDSLQPATQDGTWDTTTDPAGGSEEYILVFNRPYSDTPKPALATNGLANKPLMYFAHTFFRAPDDVIDNGDVLQFFIPVPATSNDVFVINTSTLQRGNPALQKAGLSSIRVVPNPYYNRSAYETTQFNRVIRFTNMPEQATVKIYNLAGRLIRTLRKTDPTTSILNWDLQTENQLPVGSGIYVYHVDVPGVGSTFGKLVVFMEKERLNTF